jgi:hypothetical protein
MKNAFKVFELIEETDDANEAYNYLVPTSVKSLSGEFANETEVLQSVAEAKSKGEKISGEFVVLNVKTF